MKRYRSSKPKTTPNAEQYSAASNALGALLIHGELWGLGDDKWKKPSPRRKKKLLANLKNLTKTK